MTDTRSYDDRDGWIWFDGELVPWRDAKIHVLTHALHYGSSVFEGQRAYGGEVFRLTEHSRRLRGSAALLGFELPWSVEEIDAACMEVLRANECVMHSSTPRPATSSRAGPGRLRSPSCASSRVW